MTCPLRREREGDDDDKKPTPAHKTRNDSGLGFSKYEEEIEDDAIEHEESGGE